MSNSPLISVTRLSPNCSRPRSKTITKITPHHVAGVVSVETILNIFVPTSRQASCNYAIGNDGRIGLCVDEANRAWTSSSSANDNQAITMEISNSATGPTWAIGDAAFNAMIDLMVDICKRNPGIKRKDGRSGLYFDNTPNGSLTFHDMFANTTCPGPYIRARANEICEKVNAKIDGLEPAPVPVSTPAQRPILRKGATGVFVVELQNKLNKHGAKVAADSVFGSATETAVRAFQGAKGLIVDGIVGEKTWAELDKDAVLEPIVPPAPIEPPKPTTKPALRRGSKGASVVEAQNKLIKHGFKLKYGADGVYGLETETNVRKFQTLKKLVADGIVGKNTWTELDKGVVDSKPIAIGDIVTFLGGNQYISADAKKIATANMRGGPVRVTNIVKGAHPYHVVHIDATCNVYGWVNGSTLRK